ncbi:YuzD family protein [Peribacillus sp. JNUCC 23]
MENKLIEIQVYGAERICASCVNLPSSKDTYEWLEAALSRKFPGQPFAITYIDIFQQQENPKRQEMAERIVEEDLFYPLVLIGDEIVGEGNPRLKAIVKEMERYGYQALEA